MCTILLTGNLGLADAASDRILGTQEEDAALREIPVPEEESCHWTVEADFIASIRHGAPVRLTSFENGVKYMEFTEAVHRAAGSGQAIHHPRFIGQEPALGQGVPAWRRDHGRTPAHHLEAGRERFGDHLTDGVVIII